jgi:uncharacterized protein
MRIGLISDTHNHFDARLPELFAGVERILHAGDIGHQAILDQLARIAPVTAVVGNTDSTLTLRDFEVVELAAKKFLLHHIVHPHAPSDILQQRFLREKPDVVVGGHTHRPEAVTIGQTLFLNPGYAGRQRFDQPRSVAVLHCENGVLRPEFIAL